MWPNLRVLRLVTQRWVWSHGLSPCLGFWGRSWASMSDLGRLVAPTVGFGGFLSSLTQHCLRRCQARRVAWAVLLSVA